MGPIPAPADPGDFVVVGTGANIVEVSRGLGCGLPERTVELGLFGAPTDIDRRICKRIR